MPDVEATSSAQGAGAGWEVPSEFGLGDPLSFTITAGSNTHLLGLGGTESNVAGRATERSSGSLVDLADGTRREFTTPETPEGPLWPLAAAGRADDFVVVGISCSSLTGAEGDGCSPALPHAYTLSSEGAWREIRLPDAQADQQLGSVSFLRASKGQVIGLLSFVGANNSSAYRMVSIQGTRWHDLGGVHGQPQDACTTGDAAYVLTRTTEGDEILTSHTSWSLTGFPLEHPTADPIDLPQLSGGTPSASSSPGPTPRSSAASPLAAKAPCSR